MLAALTAQLSASASAAGFVASGAAFVTNAPAIATGNMRIWPISKIPAPQPSAALKAIASHQRGLRARW